MNILNRADVIVNLDVWDYNCLKANNRKITSPTLTLVLSELCVVTTRNLNDRDRAYIQLNKF